MVRTGLARAEHLPIAPCYRGDEEGFEWRGGPLWREIAGYGVLGDGW
jgi:hypothetical protein